MSSRWKFFVACASTCLAVFLLIGSLLGQSTPSLEDTLKHIGVLQDVVAHIKSDYVEEPDMKNVTLGAINGLLISIDPFASYLNAEQYKQYTKDKELKRAGVGLVLSRKYGYEINIVDAVPGSPADKAGLNTGDIIESINGVGQVTILGGRKRQINLWLNPVKLAASGITAIDVERALAIQNITVPGGDIITGPQRLALRIEGRVATVDAISDIVVRESKDHPTRVADVARVEDGSEQETSWASEDGEQSVVLSVRKQSGENTVAVADAVRSRLTEIEKSIPGIKLQVVRDNSQSIRTSLGAVREHLILGAVFAALIVLLFLGNIRTTFIAALAIPVSIIGTFALMYAIGFTLNMVTLLALALAVGIVIDDAIVVLENIFRYMEEKKIPAMRAASEATGEIGMAVPFLPKAELAKPRQISVNVK